jgi:hypothetical protein
MHGKCRTGDLLSVLLAVLLLCFALLKLATKPLPGSYLHARNLNVFVAILEILIACNLLINRRLGLWLVVGLCLCGILVAAMDPRECGCAGSAFAMSRGLHVLLASGVGLVAVAALKLRGSSSHSCQHGLMPSFRRAK